MARFHRAVETAGAAGNPVVLCSPSIRMYLRQLLERFLPNVAILSHSEIPPNIHVLSLGMVT
jgi:flagellar biosynthesis protein FlhA